jgi:Homeodomain-like domain
MPAKVYPVVLTDAERSQFQHLIRTGIAPARKLTHARILLKADQGPQGLGCIDAEIAAALEVSTDTVARVRQQYVTQGTERALHRQCTPRPQARRLDGAGEAHLIALACSTPPQGQERWSLRLLAEKYVDLDDGRPISHETIRHALKKTNSSRI